MTEQRARTTAEKIADKTAAGLVIAAILFAVAVAVLILLG